jgi:hypothetical protein
MWCIPKVTPKFIAEMDHILELYEMPYDSAEPKVCVDEKTKQLIDNLRPSQKMREGQPTRIDYHYKRNGTRNIFVAVEPKAGKRVTRVTARKTKADYADFLVKLVQEHYSEADHVHIIADNFATHKEKALKSILGEDHPIFKKVVLHFTPTHASWLNQAEIEIGILDRQAIKGRIPDETFLSNQVVAWELDRNAQRKKINWRFTKEKAKLKFHL